MFPLPKYKMTACKLYEFQRRIVAFNAFLGYETIIFGCLPKAGLEHKDRKSVRLKSVACQRAFVQQVKIQLGLKWILIIFKMVYVPLILQSLFFEPWYEYQTSNVASRRARTPSQREPAVGPEARFGFKTWHSFNHKYNGESNKDLLTEERRVN